MDSKQDTPHHVDASSDKASIEHTETARQSGEGGAVVDDSGRVLVTQEDSKRICRRTDIYLLLLLIYVYFLQIADKQIVAYSTVFGLKEDAGLVGDQYSQIGSAGYYAQLAAQPLGAYLLVKFSPKYLMSISVFLWAVSLFGMTASDTFKALFATRFLLGFFEAIAIPLFSLLTSQYYLRSEQPLRVASWYASNGWGGAIGSAVVYGLGHIDSPVLHSYQIVFLFFAILTILIAPVLYFAIPHNVGSAWFLTPDDRTKAVERLRSNNTGIGGKQDFKWKQVFELFSEPKTYLFLLMSVCVNMGAAVVSVFSPLILQGLAGFDKFTTTLLNIPFGILQVVVIYLASYIATRFKSKSIPFAVFMVPVVVGCALLMALPRTPLNKSALLFGYYMLSFIFSANPIIVAWMTSSVAGQTKKSAMFTSFNAASAVGNILSPQIFRARDAPAYKPGLSATLGFFIGLEVLIGLQVLNLMWLNKKKEDQRERNGKPRKLVDLSMATKFDNSTVLGTKFGQNADLDLTDAANDEFTYVY
ncbi:hypothetical protein OIO90_002948 [Microbotryomycetes sp. JL221]|nr:hypothetical protein OIO90_002948 [Microbotryomycetes sp. JL221]